MKAVLRVVKKLAGGLGIAIVTVVAFGVVNSGERSEIDAALIVFGLGTTIIVVGLISRAG
jgi:hypothetical protein